MPPVSRILSRVSRISWASARPVMSQTHALTTATTDGRPREAMSPSRSRLQRRSASTITAGGEILGQSKGGGCARSSSQKSSSRRDPVSVEVESSEVQHPPALGLVGRTILVIDGEATVREVTGDRCQGLRAPHALARSGLDRRLYPEGRGRERRGDRGPAGQVAHVIRGVGSGAGGSSPVIVGRHQAEHAIVFETTVAGKQPPV